MSSIIAISVMNLNETPQTLYVQGSIMTYRADDNVIISKVEPKGIDSSMLVLDLKVIEGNGSMKGTPKAFNYENSDQITKMYSHVTLRYSIDDSLTVNIEILG